MATVGQLVHVPQDNETICHLPCAGIVSFKRGLKLYLLKLFVGNYSGCFLDIENILKLYSIFQPGYV